MRPSPVSSLLVAALVLLRQPCTRNKASARLLLDRAAEYDSLSLVEREACRNLADDLDIDDAQLSPVRTHPPATLTDWGADRRRQLAGLALDHEPKGIAA
jgi:hypothetical protein